ncbi:hypothetical protein CTA1_3231 [Colletotrichum tanaceti]|uniref:Uncharacterized protein n=1 Tax=Colletotrichum tanaceti TaxID=1306861 RepID=A0A4U6X1H8_9PEZI|nr:hypothetical protein CTA1_3231 [Colletotrichum tanaceti]
MSPFTPDDRAKTPPPLEGVSAADSDVQRSPVAVAEASSECRHGIVEIPMGMGALEPSFRLAECLRSNGIRGFSSGSVIGAAVAVVVFQDPVFRRLMPRRMATPPRAASTRPASSRCSSPPACSGSAGGVVLLQGS